MRGHGRAKGQETEVESQEEASVFAFYGFFLVLDWRGQKKFNHEVHKVTQRTDASIKSGSS